LIYISDSLLALTRRTRPPHPHAAPAQVEAETARLAPELEAIFARHALEEHAEGDKAAIHASGALHDYYVLLQMRVVGVAVSCAAIASGMVRGGRGCVCTNVNTNERGREREKERANE